MAGQNEKGGDKLGVNDREKRFIARTLHPTQPLHVCASA